MEIYMSLAPALADTHGLAYHGLCCLLSVPLLGTIAGMAAETSWDRSDVEQHWVDMDSFGSEATVSHTSY